MDAKTIKVTSDFVGSCKVLDHPADVWLEGKKHGGFHRACFRGSFTPTAGFRFEHAPGNALVQSGAERAMHQPDRLRREPRVERVEERPAAPWSSACGACIVPNCRQQSTS